MIKTDLIIIGAGPTGLFTVFEAGLLGMKCHLVDSLTKPGGQCVEIYPNKPIYDIPAHPEILAGKLVDNLLDQIKPFSPNFSLGEIAEELDKKDDHFILKTNKGTEIHGKVIVIAGGLETLNQGNHLLKVWINLRIEEFNIPLLKRKNLKIKM